MLAYGLKLWTSNVDLFDDAVRLIKERTFDFIELYYNPSEPLDFKRLGLLKQANVIAVHNPHSHGWHEFFLTGEQPVQWLVTCKLADFFGADRIVIHPAQSHTLDTFLTNVQKIDDPRILVENQAGLDIHNRPMFGQDLGDLRIIREHKPICFDFEKAGSAAHYQSCKYQQYVSDCLRELGPTYFHISGRWNQNPIDQHNNLWESDLDLPWIKEQLFSVGENRDLYLVFETPKANGLGNDVKNLEYFKKVAL